MTDTATAAPTYRYIVQMIDGPITYDGPDFDAAVAAVLAIDIDAGQEGWATAWRSDGLASAYEAERVESTAMGLSS